MICNVGVILSVIGNLMAYTFVYDLQRWRYSVRYWQFNSLYM